MKNNFPKVGAALLLVFSFVLILMGKPAQHMPIDHLEDASAIIAQAEDTIEPQTLAEWLIDEKPGLKVVDIRSSYDFAQYNIPGSINIPVEELLSIDGLDMLPERSPVVLVCTETTRSSQAWLILRSKGFDAYALHGGINAWVTQVLDEPSDSVKRDADLYAKVNAIRSKFLGGSTLSTAPPPPPPPVAKPASTGGKRKKPSGGC